MRWAHGFRFDGRGSGWRTASQSIRRRAGSRTGRCDRSWRIGLSALIGGCTRNFVRPIPSAIAAFPDMSDAFYRLVRSVGLPVFALSSRASVLHADRLKGKGPLIIAANHLSPYDIPCLMASTSRVLDFVAMSELFRHQAGARFFR